MSPKEQFLTIHKKHADEFVKLINEPCVQVAVTSAIAEFMTDGATTEEIGGVRKFIGIFTKIGDVPKTSRLPSKELKTYG